MTAPQLATATFVSGPDDSLIVIDVYDGGGSGVVNSYQETHPEAIDVLGGLGGDGGGGGGDGGGGSGAGGGGDEDDWDLVDSNEDIMGPNNDIDDLMGGLDGAPDIGSLGDLSDLTNFDSDLMSDIGGLGDGLRDAFTSISEFGNEIFAQVGDVISKLPQGVNFKAAMDVANVINQLSCGNGPGVFSQSGMSRLIANAAGAGSRMGIPNAFSSMARGGMGCGKVTSNSLARAVVSMVPDIAKRANIPLLNDIARSPFGNIVAKVDPGIVGNTIRNIRKPTYLNQQDYGSYYGTARDTFGIVDPNWNTTSFGNRSVLNATVVSQNSFMQEALLANVTTRPLQITPAQNGNSRYTNESDVYYHEPDGYDRDYGTGGESYDEYGVLSPADPIDLYHNRTTNRQADTFIAAAAAFGENTVANVLAQQFSKVNAKVNRTISLL